MRSGGFLIGTLWAKYLKSCLSYSLDENQHEKRGLQKSQGPTKMTLKMQNLAFQLFNFKQHGKCNARKRVVHDIFTRIHFSRWKLFVTFEEHAKDAWNNNWKCSHQPMGNLLILLFFPSSDYWLFYRKLCFGCVDFAPGILHCKASIFHSSDFAIQRYSDAFRTALWNMSALSVIRVWTLNYCLNATNLDMTKISTGFKEQKAQSMHRPRWLSVQHLDKACLLIPKNYLDS